LSEGLHTAPSRLQMPEQKQIGCVVLINVLPVVT
jgi:hypothetical protein